MAEKDSAKYCIQIQTTNSAGQCLTQWDTGADLLGMAAFNLSYDYWLNLIKEFLIMIAANGVCTNLIMFSITH